MEAIIILVNNFIFLLKVHNQNLLQLCTKFLRAANYVVIFVYKPGIQLGAAASPLHSHLFIVFRWPNNFYTVYVTIDLTKARSAVGTIDKQ